MEFCRIKKALVPPGSTICPFHKSKDCLASHGSAKPIPTGGPPPTRRATGADADALRFELSGLECRVKAGRRRGRLLIVGAVLAICAAIGTWMAVQADTVRSYAEAGDLTIARDPTDPARITVGYHARTSGRIGIRRTDVDRETEFIDRATGTGCPQRMEWRWAKSKDGDIVRVTTRKGWSLVTQELTIPAMGPPSSLGTAVLAGRVINATTGEPLVGADIRVAGTTLRTISTSTGEYRLSGLPSGLVGIKVSALQFITVEVEKELSAETENRLDQALSPGLSRGQLRLVLTWEDGPADLDAHLEGPLPDKMRFHIFWGDKGDLKSKEFVRLDLDQRKGPGTETISVLGVQPGTYRYFVHYYTDEPITGSGALGQSRAKVEIYQGQEKSDQMLRRFTARPVAIGNVWYVCDVEVSADQKVRVVPIDNYKDERLRLQVQRSLVMVLDNSVALSSSQLNRLKEVATNLNFKVENVGVVSSGSRGSRSIAPTTNTSKWREAISETGAGGKDALAVGLESAFKTLEASRGLGTVVILTHGSPSDRAAVDRWRDQLKKKNIYIEVIGIGKPDMEFLRSLASDPKKVTVISDE